MKTRPMLTDRAQLIKRLIGSASTVPDDGLNVILALPQREYRIFMKEIEDALFCAELEPLIEDARMAAFLGGVYLGYSLAKHDLTDPKPGQEADVDGTEA